MIAGGAHSCAVADGLAFCWGDNTYGQLGNGSNTGTNTPIAVDASGVLMGRSVSQVAAGGAHTCAIADGRAYCWGQGASGQLGNFAAAASSSPVTVATSIMSGSVVALSAGAMTSCAAAGGNAYCWGAGASYGLGNGGTANATAPVLTNGALSGRSVLAVSAGTSFGCAIGGGSPAACWGLGGSYQQGDGDAGSNTIPSDVSLSGSACPDGSVRLSATTCSLAQGTSYSYRLGYSLGPWTAPVSEDVTATTRTRDGVNPSATAKAATSLRIGWGAPQEPGRAYPEYTLQRSTSADGSGPVTLTTTADTTYTDAGGLAPSRSFGAVSAGTGHSCGIVGGDLYCWGGNPNGQLGVGDTTRRTVPTRVAALDGKSVTAVSAGASHTCAIADGKVYCWGQGASGQLGNGTNNGSSTPVLVSGQTATATAVSAGGSHTCAIMGGAARCWGNNSDGQLGTGSTTSTNTPVAVSGSGDLGSQSVTAITAGGTYSCAVGSDKLAYCWGDNSSYQLGSRYCVIQIAGLCLGGSPTQDRATPVAVETAGAMGSKNVTSISAGSTHTCAVAGGRAYCWGSDASGQLGDNGSTTTRLSQAVTTSAMTAPVTSLSAGANSTCAIADGSAWCWGANGSGQLGNSSTAASRVPVALTTGGALKGATVADISAGAVHGCVVASGQAYCWGSGDDGRLGTRATTASAVPVATLAEALCANSVPLGDGSCSLKSGSTYYYRVTFTLDGLMRTRGDWVGIKTSG